MRKELPDKQRFFIERVALSYREAEVYDATVTDSWVALSDYVREQYQKLNKALAIELTQDDPYRSYRAMRQDIIEHGRLQVYTGNCAHLVWSNEENLRFRAVHDYYGHFHCDQPFTLLGEFCVYYHHSHCVPREAQVALFSELIGELCYYFYFNDYVPAHKVCNLLQYRSEFLRLFLSLIN